jgi:hypothetical protein
VETYCQSTLSDDDGLFLLSQIVLIQRVQSVGEGLTVMQVMSPAREMMLVPPMMSSVLAMTLSL